MPYKLAWLVLVLGLIACQRAPESQPSLLFSRGPSDGTKDQGLKNIAVNQYMAQLYLEKQKSNEPPSIETLINNFSECNPDSRPPTVRLTAENPKLIENDHVQVGKPIVFQSTGSAAAAGAPGKISVNWFVHAPYLSRVPTNGGTDAMLTLVPDAVGRYEITLLIRDSRGACRSTTKYIAATDNPERVPVPPVRRLTSIGRERFPHLNIVQAEKAWRLAQGKGIKIAIVDTGVNYNHPDLNPNLASNENEIPGNRRDDDGNGLIDDEFGWDFVNSDNRPFDDDSHGTHVAGLAAATTMGIAPNAKILPIKVLNGIGGGDVATIAKGIMYAADQGAQIINLSFGSFETSFKALAPAIEYASNKGSIVVAAAGNGDINSGWGTNLDVFPVYPAAFPNANLITVAASHNGQLARYSNFGRSSVDLAAPGGEGTDAIQSTAHWNRYDTEYYGRSGTSMSAPLVSGTIALMLELQPLWSPEKIREVLSQTGTFQPKLKSLLNSSVVLNSYEAVRFAYDNAKHPHQR